MRKQSPERFPPTPHSWYQLKAEDDELGAPILCCSCYTRIDPEGLVGTLISSQLCEFSGQRLLVLGCSHDGVGALSQAWYEVKAKEDVVGVIWVDAGGSMMCTVSGLLVQLRCG